jgi:hypothetical protein
MPGTLSDLSALEILDAAGAEIPVDRMEATALILSARGVLQSQRLRVRAANGRRASSDDLLRALLDAADGGRIQRYRGVYRLTAAGHAALDEYGGRANDRARAEAIELSQMEAAALWAEADRSAMV